MTSHCTVSLHQYTENFKSNEMNTDNQPSELQKILKLQKILTNDS